MVRLSGRSGPARVSPRQKRVCPLAPYSLVALAEEC